MVAYRKTSTRCSDCSRISKRSIVIPLVVRRLQRWTRHHFFDSPVLLLRSESNFDPYHLARQNLFQRIHESASFNRLLERSNRTALLRQMENVNLPELGMTSGHRHDFHPAKFIVHFPNRLQAFLLRHEDVAENEVGGTLTESLDAVAAIASLTDFVTVALQHFPKDCSHLDVVVDHHD